MKFVTLYFLAFVHLTIATIGSFAPKHMHGYLNKFFIAYKATTGAGQKYGFFAPSVSSNIRVEIESNEISEKHIIDTPKYKIAEVQIRIGNIFENFMNRVIQDKEAYATSWAKYMSTINPDTDRVLIRVDAQSIPSMKDYRRGLKPAWIRIDSFVFRAENNSKTDRKPVSIESKRG